MRAGCKSLDLALVFKCRKCGADVGTYHVDCGKPWDRQLNKGNMGAISADCDSAVLVDYDDCEGCAEILDTEEERLKEEEVSSYNSEN